jgi:hypothetical protein
MTLFVWVSPASAAAATMTHRTLNTILNTISIILVIGLALGWYFFGDPIRLP